MKFRKSTVNPFHARHVPEQHESTTASKLVELTRIEELEPIVMCAAAGIVAEEIVRESMMKVGIWHNKAQPGTQMGARSTQAREARRRAVQPAFRSGIFLLLRCALEFAGRGRGSSAPGVDPQGHSAS